MERTCLPHTNTSGRLTEFDESRNGSPARHLQQGGGPREDSSLGGSSEMAGVHQLRLLEQLSMRLAPPYIIEEARTANRRSLNR